MIAALAFMERAAIAAFVILAAYTYLAIARARCHRHRHDIMLYIMVLAASLLFR